MEPRVIYSAGSHLLFDFAHAHPLRRFLVDSFLTLPSEDEILSSELRSEIVTHRLLCLLGAVLVPLFGFFHNLTAPESVDPRWARLALSGLFAGLFVASFWAEHVRRNFALWMWSIPYVLMGWFVIIATLNEFGGGYVAGLLVTFAVLTAVVGVGARSLAPVLWFEGVGVLFTVGGIVFGPTPQTSPLILVSCLATVTIVQSVAIQGQVATREALRERERHLHGLANSIPGVVFQFSAGDGDEYGFNFISEQAEELVGLDPQIDDFHDQFIARVPSSRRQALIRSIDTAVEQEDPWRNEIPITRGSNEQSWLLVTATPDRREKELVFNGMALDITARKRAETQAELQSQVLNQVMEGAPFRAVLVDLVRNLEEQRPEMKGSILLYDESAGCVRHGAAPNLPDPYNKAVDGIEVGPKAGSCGTAIYTGEAVIAEDIREDPRWEDYRDLALEHGLRACWSIPFRNSDGELLGTFAMYYDEPRTPSTADRALINNARSLASLAVERHRNAEELRLLSEAVGQSTDAVVITKHAGSEQLPGPITYVNQAFTEITGYEEEDVIGKSPELLHGPDTEPWVLQRLTKRLEAGEEFEGEALHYRKDGTPFVSYVSIAPVQNSSGEITHWVSVQRDVTEDRQTGERMLEVHDEERRRIDKDIRQDIGGLLATLQMTLYGVQGEMKERGVPTDRIQEAQDLVQDVADVARTISDRLHPTPLGDHGLLDVLPSLLKRMEKQHGLKVRLQADGLESDDDIGSLVQMIAFHVVQEALRNVVQHAETDEAEVIVRQPTQKLHLEIVDDGEGFDPDEIEPEETYGLFGMKKRVERLNGELEVGATPGRGTKIAVTLPRMTSFANVSGE